MKKSYIQYSGGQALVMLLFYVAIALTVISFSIALTISNSLGSMQEEQGNHALEIAESGAENAVLRLVRDPAYTGETLTVGSGDATVTVGGQATKTIISTGVASGFSKVVQVVAQINDGIVTLLSWQEL